MRGSECALTTFGPLSDLRSKSAKVFVLFAEAANEFRRCSTRFFRARRWPSREGSWRSTSSRRPSCSLTPGYLANAITRSGPSPGCTTRVRCCDVDPQCVPLARPLPIRPRFLCLRWLNIGRRPIRSEPLLGAAGTQSLEAHAADATADVMRVAIRPHATPSAHGSLIAR